MSRGGAARRSRPNCRGRAGVASPRMRPRRGRRGAAIVRLAPGNGEASSARAPADGEPREASNLEMTNQTGT